MKIPVASEIANQANIKKRSTRWCTPNFQLARNVRAVVPVIRSSTIQAMARKICRTIGCLVYLLMMSSQDEVVLCKNLPVRPATGDRPRRNIT